MLAEAKQIVKLTMKIAKIITVLAALAGFALTSCGGNDVPVIAPPTAPSVTFGK